MGNNLLPADTTRYADNIRADTMGIQHFAEMGRSVGEVAHKVFNGTFLRSHALLRRVLCATVIRYCTLYPI